MSRLAGPAGHVASVACTIDSQPSVLLLLTDTAFGMSATHVRCAICIAASLQLCQETEAARLLHRVSIRAAIPPSMTVDYVPICALPVKGCRRRNKAAIFNELAYLLKVQET